jgi:5-oxoprolinase (ATP-hydrolysing)
VAGGSGAGPTWHGRSGVHVHMTNTRYSTGNYRYR